MPIEIRELVIRATVDPVAAKSGSADSCGVPQGKDGKDKKDDFPPFETVIKGMEKVVSTADGSEPFYTLYANKKDGSLVAELPRDFENKLLLIAPTVAGGDEEAGVMGGTIYGYWKRIDKSLVLMEPNFAVKSTGDKESQTSIKQLFTDRVLVDVPISTMGPGGGPVIDLKNLFVAQAGKWFTPAFGGYGPSVAGVNPRLLILEKAKAFPQNIEITYQMPDARGRLVSLHYSVRNLPENPGYKPRLADSRVGYFNIYYNDLGKPGSDEPFTRYITRWQLEKADPSLKLGPPKQPIVWYIEHTTPVRYRRWVRDGILSWNTAFEACGFFNAVEVYQQDASTGEHMDKDPEDCRYNFFRWNTTNQGYAIGPSRWDPRTGQILDADVVWHEGLTNSLRGMYRGLSGDIAVQHFGPETLAWLDEHPEFDPRIAFATGPERQALLAAARERAAGKVDTPSTHAAAHLHTAQQMIRLELHEAAETELRRALALDARAPQAHALLGQLAVNRARLDEGVALFRQAIDVNPLDAMAYYRLGEAYSRQQKWDDAIAALQQSLWINPYFSGPYIVLGRAYMTKGETQTAEGMLRRAVEYDPNNKSAHYLLGQALQALGREADAAHEFEIAARLTDSAQPR